MEVSRNRIYALIWNKRNLYPFVVPKNTHCIATPEFTPQSVRCLAIVSTLQVFPETLDSMRFALSGQREQLPRELKTLDDNVLVDKRRVKFNQSAREVLPPTKVKVKLRARNQSEREKLLATDRHTAKRWYCARHICKCRDEPEKLLQSGIFPFTTVNIGNLNARACKWNANGEKIHFWFTVVVDLQEWEARRMANMIAIKPLGVNAAPVWSVSTSPSLATIK